MNSELKPYGEYKKTEYDWLGAVPSHWKVVKNSILFSEIVDTDHNELELLSITRTKGVVQQSSTGRKIRMSKDNSNYKRIQRGDIGYNLMNAFMGSIGTSKYEGIISPAYAVCRPKLELNSWYYHYLFRTPLYSNEFDKHSYGIMYERNRLYFDRFKRIGVVFPTLDEQNQIVKYLDSSLAKINKFIKAKKKQVALLKEQRQAVINQAVTKGLDPNAKMKPSGIDWLGDIPEGWIVTTLSRISKIILSGLDKKSYANQNNIKLCNYVDVYKNDYITNDLDFMEATASDAEMQNLKLLKNDIIITKDSESWDDIAVPSFVNEDLENVYCGYHLAIIRTMSENVVSEFIYSAFRSQYVAMQYKVKAKGVTRYSLGYQPIHDTILFFPAFEKEQQEIVNYINDQTQAIDESISIFEQEIALMTEYRTSLISDVVTGKVDVRDIVVDDTTEDLEELDLGEQDEEDVEDKEVLDSEEY